MADLPFKEELVEVVCTVWEAEAAAWHIRAAGRSGWWVERDLSLDELKSSDPLPDIQRFNNERDAKEYKREQMATAILDAVLPLVMRGALDSGVVRAGQRLSNAAYNLSQSAALDDRTRASLREGCDEWDVARRTVRQWAEMIGGG